MSLLPVVESTHKLLYEAASRAQFYYKNDEKAVGTE